MYKRQLGIVDLRRKRQQVRVRLELLKLEVESLEVESLEVERTLTLVLAGGAARSATWPGNAPPRLLE